jgi:hypothetical protein
VHAVAEGQVLLVCPGDAELVRGATPGGVSAGGGVGGQDRRSLADHLSVGEGYVVGGVAEWQVFHRRFEAQGLLDHVVPAGASLADVGQLVGVGEQSGDGLVDGIAGGLVSGTDQHQEGVAQFRVGEAVVVALLVAGGDQEGGHVVGGRDAFPLDQLVEPLVGRVGVRGGLVGAEGGGEDAVDQAA